MIFIQEHLQGGGTLTKKTYIVRDVDYELVNKVFPERGYNAHLPGFLYFLLAQKLREKGIENVNDRFNKASYADIGGLMSDLLATDETCSGNDGRGTDKVRSRSTSTKRVATDSKEVTRKRKAKDNSSKNKKG